MTNRVALTFLIVLAVLFTWRHPGPLGRGCLEGRPTTCGALALLTIGSNQWSLGQDCLHGRPVTCGLLSMGAIAADQP